MVVNNVKIYDLEESMKASGYPMRTSTDWEEDKTQATTRCSKLSHAADWTGAHDQFLTGIKVNFDLTFSNKAWVEMERYRFVEFISSQSTMHKISSFNLKAQCNRYVDQRIIDIVQEKINEYNRLKKLDLKADKTSENREKILSNLYLEILYNVPSGFELTARLTTNYRALKNVWRQRRNHRLPEWREFCKWIETLPYAKELICFEDQRRKE